MKSVEDQNIYIKALDRKKLGIITWNNPNLFINFSRSSRGAETTLQI